MYQDVISTYRVKKNTPPPLVPLCRLVINESIRTVRENVVALGPMFRDMGYLKELGVFLVSVKRIGEPELEVSRYDLDDWGPVWRDVNSEFEQELLRNQEWIHLSNKKFIIWDGNHRVQAWMNMIKQGTLNLFVSLCICFLELSLLMF